MHLLFGVAGLVLARTASTSGPYLVGGGVIYLVLWFYGLVVDQMSSANFVPVNTADNWLHLGLGVAMIGLGIALGRTRPRATTRTSAAALNSTCRDPRRAGHGPDHGC